MTSRRSTILKARGTGTAKDCSTSEPCRLISTVSVPARSEKRGPDFDYFLEQYVPASNSRPHCFKLFPMLFITGCPGVSEIRESDVRAWGAADRGQRVSWHWLSPSLDLGVIRHIDPLSQLSRSLPLFQLSDTLPRYTSLAISMSLECKKQGGGSSREPRLAGTEWLDRGMALCHWHCWSIAQIIDGD